MSMTATDQKNLDFVLEGLKDSWEKLSSDQRMMIKTFVEMVTANTMENKKTAAIASLYQPLSREEMFASMDRGLAEAERGEGQALEEISAEFSAEFGFAQ